MSSAQSTRESPTVRRRRLGREIRMLRERSELTLDEAGVRMNWSDSKLSRLERGQGVVRWGDISDLLDLYEMEGGPARDALVQLARDANLVGWWQPYSDILSKDYSTYIDLETAATSLRQYQTLVVPGLLQTPDYARSIITDSGALNYRSDEVERRVTLRMERQAVLADKNPLNLWAILDEATLHREIGGPHVMSEQLRHLAESARHPQVTLQVIPFNAGPHASMAGTFGVFSFGEDAADVAYSDLISGTMYLERAAEVRPAIVAFDHLRAAALSPAQTIQRLNAIAEAYAQKE